MFNVSWKNRIVLLENKIAKIEREKECAKGEHDWEMYISVIDKLPNTRCKYCYFHPKSNGSAS